MRRVRLPLGEGRTAQKLREMLAQQGYIVDYFIFPNGWWRSNQADVMRWEAGVISPSYCDGHIPFLIGSWDTMTECVKNGFTVNAKAKSNMSGGVEVHANPRKQVKQCQE